MHKPEEFGLEETQKFIPLENSEPCTKVVDPSSSAQVFNGLSKNEIIKYGSDPFWVRIRWTVFAIFWLAWIGMLVLAIIIVISTPNCPYRPKLQWWQSEVIYQLDVTKFKDTNGDGIGDLQGVIEKLNYVKKLGAKVVCLNENWLDAKDPNKITEKIGKEEDIKMLKKNLEEKDMFLILDIPVNALDEKDEEIITKWLTDYADGIRITIGTWKLDDVEKRNKINKWVNLGQNLLKKTFKPKMVMLYPYTIKDQGIQKPNLIVNQNLLNITDVDLKDSATLIKKVQFFNDETSYILDDFITPERIRDRLNNTQFRTTYHGLVLLLKGTPIILYGDELEYTKSEKNMKWDNSNPACGFTTNETTFDDCNYTVKHAQSYGSNKSLFKIYEKLIKLRTNEPSFKWGNIGINNNSINVVSYVREAHRFDGFVIVGNIDNQRHLVDLAQLHSLPNEAKVEYYHAADEMPSPDFSHNQVVHIDNVQVKPGDFIVLRFSRENSLKDSKESDVVTAHG